MKRILVLFITVISGLVVGQTVHLTASDTVLISFRVQFAAVSMPLNLMDVKYKDLPSLECYKLKTSHLFRYSSGYFTKLVDATQHKDLLIRYGLSDSHIVAIKNGRQIKLEDIAKYMKNE